MPAGWISSSTPGSAGSLACAGSVASPASPAPRRPPRGVGQHAAPATAREERSDDLVEALLHLRERRREALADLAREAADDALELAHGGRQVVDLRAHVVEPLALLLELLLGQRVDGTELAAAPLEALDARRQPRELLGRQRLDGVDGGQAVLLGQLGGPRAQLGEALLGVRRLALERARARGGVALGARVLGLVARALAQGDRERLAAPRQLGAALRRAARGRARRPRDRRRAPPRGPRRRRSRAGPGPRRARACGPRCARPRRARPTSRSRSRRACSARSATAARSARARATRSASALRTCSSSACSASARAAALRRPPQRASELGGLALGALDRRREILRPAGRPRPARARPARRRARRARDRPPPRARRARPRRARRGPAPAPRRARPRRPRSASSSAVAHRRLALAQRALGALRSRRRRVRPRARGARAAAPPRRSRPSGTRRRGRRRSRARRA